MIFLYTVIFSYYTIMRHYTFQTVAYDMGIFLNSFYNTLYEGKFLYTTLWEGIRFQNHFSPILLLILPVYKIFPGAETLLILQSFMLALGALPIYMIAKKEISSKAGVIFALLYLIYPALHGVNRFDFHEVAFAPVFILFTFYYYKEKNYTISTIFLVLALISREDVAMAIVPMAIFWLWEIRSKWSRRDPETIFCFSTIVLSLFWFFLATKIVSDLNPDGYWFADQYKPIFLLVNYDKKLVFLVAIFGPLFFTSLFNKFIWVSLPIFARNLFTYKTSRYSLTNQHTALLIPIIFISSIYFVKYISENMDESIKKYFSGKFLYSFLALIMLVNLFVDPIPYEIVKNNPISKLIIVPEGGPSPIVDSVLSITPHHRAMAEIISMIPRNASIYSQNNIFPHLSDRPYTYYVPGDLQIFKGWNNPQTALIVPWKDVDFFEYILVDDTYKNQNPLRKMDIESLDILSKNYGLYIVIDRIYLFKKGYSGVPNLLPTLMKNFDNNFLSEYYNGIFASYYNNNDFSNVMGVNTSIDNMGNLSNMSAPMTNANNFSYGPPILIDRVQTIKFSWAKKSPSPIPGVIHKYNFGIKFDSYLYVPVDGIYSFQLLSSNGARLFINNELVIDAWNFTTVETHFQSYLNKGLYKIRIDYRKYQSTSPYIYLKWLTPWKGQFEFIPEEYFYVPKENIDNIYNTFEYTVNNSTNVANNNNNVSVTDNISITDSAIVR
jgi:uncharacterized membrane protein